jgi:hypothetical protein
LKVYFPINANIKKGGIDVETFRYLARLPFQKIDERSLLMYSQLTPQIDAVPA